VAWLPAFDPAARPQDSSRVIALAGQRVVLVSPAEVEGEPLHVGSLDGQPLFAARLAGPAPDDAPTLRGILAEGPGELAQAAGRACLRDRDYLARSRVLVRQEREFLLEGLQSLPGLQPFPSEANYLLVKITQPDWTAASLRTALLSAKLVIRDASNFRGLDGRFFRLAVRRREENQRLLEALRHFLT